MVRNMMLTSDYPTGRKDAEKVGARAAAGCLREPYCALSVDSIFSNAAWFWATVFSGPVNLKKMEPCGPSAIAPKRRYPGFGAPAGARGPPIPVYPPDTSTVV